MGRWLYTLEPGDCLGPASEQVSAAFEQALLSGKPFLLHGHHGYNLKVVVRERETKSTA